MILSCEGDISIIQFNKNCMTAALELALEMNMTYYTSLINTT